MVLFSPAPGPSDYHHTAPFTFIPPCQGLSLFPKIKGGENVGCDTDIGRCHVLDGDWGADGGSHPTAPHTAST